MRCFHRIGVRSVVVVRQSLFSSFCLRLRHPRCMASRGGRWASIPVLLSLVFFFRFLVRTRACPFVGRAWRIVVSFRVSHLVLGYLGSLACLSVLGLWKVTVVLFLRVFDLTPPFLTALAAFLA